MAIGGSFGSMYPAYKPAPRTGTGTAPIPGGGHGNPVPSSAANSSQRQYEQGPTYGSESGPGILESRYNQRANGTDPAYEYAMKRGMQSLGDRFGAAGLANSGAARQQESDYAANMAAQSMGQLDALAGGASGEHMGRVGMSFQQAMALAQGQAGAGTAYDLGAAGNMSAAADAQRNMALNSAIGQQGANQGFAKNLMSLAGAYGAYSGGRGGYGTVDGGAGNPYPQY